MKNREIKLQELARRLVDREVYACVSSLVGDLYTLVSNADHNTLQQVGVEQDELMDLMVRRDYETPATEFIRNDADFDQLEEIVEENGYWADTVDEVMPKFPDLMKKFRVDTENPDDDDDQTSNEDIWAFSEEDARDKALSQAPDGHVVTGVAPQDADLEEVCDNNPGLEVAIRAEVEAQVGDESAHQWVCDEYGLDPEEVEAFEFYIVSSWLAGRLSNMGYATGDICGLTIYGRTCTGQSMALDYNMQQIAAGLWPDELAEAEKADAGDKS